MVFHLPGLGVVWDAARAAARRFPEALVASLATGVLMIFRIDDVLPEDALVYRTIGTLGLGIPIAFALACGGERRGWGLGTRVVAMVGFGLVSSWWAVLAVPAAMLIAFAFAGAGLGLTTYMRSWVDFDYVNLALVPMFLFSATFFPISTYPAAIQWIVRFSPLYHAIRLERAFNLGLIGWAQAVDIAYLLVLGLVGLYIAQRRLGKLLLK